MNIYPAIDLKSGACVRLYQGCYDQVTLYENDPLTLAKSFFKDGAMTLHIVDLDGAKQGESINADLIIKIAQESGLQIQSGGGIRTKQQIAAMLNKGIHRIVLGSTAILQPDNVKNWIQEFGPERIVLALDIRIDTAGNPMLALQGWQEASKKTLWEVLDEYRDSLLKHVLCTDISRDGTLSGVNINLYRECIHRYPTLYFQASGGVSTLSDLCELAALSVSGVIIGKALYENKFSLRDAINAVTSC